MLKIKSFRIEDDAGMNELLSSYILAKEAHILVSNGQLAIPYEDGEQPTAAQLIIGMKEQKNVHLLQMDLLIHSQLVLETQGKGITVELEKLEAMLDNTPKGKKAYDANKKIDDEIKRLKNVEAQTQNQILMNQAELTRLKTNIEVFDQRINELLNGEGNQEKES